MDIVLALHFAEENILGFLAFSKSLGSLLQKFNAAFRFRPLCNNWPCLAVKAAFLPRLHWREGFTDVLAYSEAFGTRLKCHCMLGSCVTACQHISNFQRFKPRNVSVQRALFRVRHAHKASLLLEEVIISIGRRPAPRSDLVWKAREKAQCRQNQLNQL